MGTPVQQVATAGSLARLWNQMPYNVRNYGALGNGVADDTTAINAAIAAAQTAGGGVVYLPPGTYLVTAPLAVTVAGITILGAGQWASTIQPKAGFTGAAVITATSANGFECCELGIVGVSSTYSSNPVCDGIDVTTSYVVKLTNIYTAFLNGWGVQIATSASLDGFSPCLHNVFTTRGKGGIHIQGFTGHTSIGAVLTNCAGDQAQALDGFLLEDAVDVQLVNCGGYSLGSTIPSVHVKGGGFITCSGGDFGATNAGVGPCLLIEASALGSPNAVMFTNNVIEKGSTGVTITAGADIIISSNLIYFNNTHGILATGGAGIVIANNVFDGNGQTAAAGHYDCWINTGGSNPALITGNLFRTTQGTGAGQVQFAVKGNGTTTHVIGNYFVGATGANAIDATGQPAVARANSGYNPIGQVTAPAFPATTVAAVNTTGVDVTAYIANGTSAITVVQVAGIAGTYVTTGLQIAASGWGSVRIPAGGGVKFTYAAGAPTWTWFGD